MVTRNTQGSTMRDKVRRMAEEVLKSGGSNHILAPEGMEFWKPEAGTVTFNILPYKVSVDKHSWVEKDDLWFEKTYTIHKNIGPQKRWYICPRTVDKKCPICEQQDILREEGAEQDIIDALRGQKKQIINVDLNGKDVLLWDVPFHNFGKKLMEEVANEDPEVADFFLLNGFSLKVRFTKGTFRNNSFIETSKIDFVDREPLKSNLLDKTVDLDKALNILSYDELKKAFLGVEEDTEEKPVDETFAADREARAEREAKPEETTRRRRVKREEPEEAQVEVTEGNPCPYGHGYGVDTDNTDDCAECGNDDWEACKQKQNDLKADKPKRPRR